MTSADALVGDVGISGGTCPLLDWLPDETLFSLCSRHHRYWGYSTSWQSAEVMFGGRRAGTQHDLPSGLDEFVSRTDSSFGTSQQISRDQTLLRYYRAFLSPSVTEAAVQAMRGPSVAHLKFKLGLLTSRFRANHPLKACHRCMRDDVERSGWTYWHLRHQFPGVWVCTVHGTALHVSEVKSNGVERFLWHLPDEARISDNWFSGRQTSLVALQSLANLTIGLIEFKADDAWLEASSVQETLRTALANRGWLTSGGNIRITDAATDYLQQCVELRVAPELSYLPSTLEEAKVQVSHLVRPFRTGTHPLRLLVAIDWLFDGLHHFISTHLGSDSLPVVGTEDAAQVAKQVPATALIDDRRERLVQFIRAGNSVSFAASKIGIDVATAQIWATKEGIAISLRPKILKADVRSSLVQNLRDGVEKAEAASQHGISVATVNKVLRTEVGIHAAWRAARATKAQKAARQTWLDLVASDGALGIKLLRAMNPAVYAWLYRNDLVWLKAHVPTAGSGAKPPLARSVRWDQRDDELSRAVDRVALQLSREHASKPIRLWQIYQVLPELKAKLPALERLPQTRHALEVALGRRRRKSSNTRLFD